MSIIKVTVDDQALYLTESPVVAAQGVNENYFQFTLSEDWTGFGVVALFWKEGNETDVYESVVDGTGKALVPHEVTDSQGRICVGLAGTKGNIIHTSEVLKYKIVKGKYTAGQSSEPPTPGIYEQMLSLAGQMSDQFRQVVVEQNQIISGLQSDQAALRTELVTDQETFEDVITGRMDTFIAAQSGDYKRVTLWTSPDANGIIARGTTVTLSEEIENFDYVEIYGMNTDNDAVETIPVDEVLADPGYAVRSVNISALSIKMNVVESRITISGTTFTIANQYVFQYDDSTPVRQITQDNKNQWVGQFGIMKIVGRKMVENAEVTDIRVGENGTTYQTAGAAVRGQIAETKALIPGVDASLATAGKAADAKATGDAFTTLNGRLDDAENALMTSMQVYPNVNVGVQDGKYVNATNNAIAESNNFAMTDPIAVKKGQRITYYAKGYNNVVGMIATCNADNTSRTTVVASLDSEPHTYTYDVQTDGYVVLSYSKAVVPAIDITIDYYKYVVPLNDSIIFKGTESVNPGIGVDRSFVNATNNTVVSNSNYRISETIKLYKGQKLILTAYGYSTTTGMICEYDSTTDSYNTLVPSTASGLLTYEYTATKTTYVRCTYNRTQNVSFAIYTPETRFTSFDNLYDEIDKITDPLSEIQYPQLFDNILCIGDSLTVGYDGSGDTQITKNYPHFFKKLADAETTIRGHGGYTAKQVWDSYISASTDLANYDCAIIYLGTNGGLTDTVDTDCNASDFTQNADTNTGCYGKIIGKIRADAPNCKIFCVAGPNEYFHRDTTMNHAVRDLATLYGVGLLDIAECILSDNGSGSSTERQLYRPIDGIHYNALGYMTLANMFYDAMSTFMGEHRSIYS